MRMYPLSRVLRPLSAKVRSSVRLAPLVLTLLASSAFADVALTYAATFGRVSPTGDGIVRSALTTNVMMTVALYSSSSSDAPLWCRRFSADVVDGSFAVVLADDVGTDVSTGTNWTHHAQYAKLSRFLQGTQQAAQTWVEVSDVRADGLPLAPDVATALPRGKLTAVPYALVAERALGARNSFRVNGTATVAGLESIGAVTVEGTASFRDAVTFNDRAEFGAQGLTVTGVVSKTTMKGVGTLAAGNLTVSENLTADTLAVTNGASTRLTASPSGYRPPQTIRAAETLAVSQTLQADAVKAASLTVRGDFILNETGSFDWDRNGTLLVPDGVYEADDENRNLTDVYSGSSGSTYQNGTGRNVLVTYAVGAGSGSVPTATVNGQNWIQYGVSGTSSVGIDVTTLFPLANGDKATATTVLTRYVKELSK